MRSVITVSRKWNNPEILTTLSVEGIELSISLEDFTEALLREIGSVTWIVKDGTFRKKFSQAIDSVIAGIKEESAKVM